MGRSVQRRAAGLASWWGGRTMAKLAIPVKLLHEALGHIVTVEMKSGEMSVVLSSCHFFCHTDSLKRLIRRNAPLRPPARPPPSRYSNCPAISIISALAPDSRILGHRYRGKLISVSDNMNCQFSDISMTDRNGKSSQVKLYSQRAPLHCFP